VEDREKGVGVCIIMLLKCLMSIYLLTYESGKQATVPVVFNKSDRARVFCIVFVFLFLVTGAGSNESGVGVSCIFCFLSIRVTGAGVRVF